MDSKDQRETILATETDDILKIINDNPTVFLGDLKIPVEVLAHKINRNRENLKLNGLILPKGKVP